MGIKSGEHGRATLRGYLSGPPSAVALQEEPVRITVQGSGEAEQLLFQGVIQDAITFYENGVCQVILSALTNDVKLDRKEKSRSFQDKSDTYARIMKEAAGSMDGEVRCSHPPVQTGHPVIQFQETDWEFCRRMASSLGLAVYSDPLSPVPALEVGLVEKGGGISLSSGQLSGVLETEEGFYLVKCLNNYDAESTAKNKSRLEGELKNQEFSRLFLDFPETVSVKYNGAAWEKLELSGVPCGEADFYGIFKEYLGA